MLWSCGSWNFNGAGKCRSYKKLESERAGVEKEKPMAATPPQAQKEKKEKERGKREQKETKQKRELLLRT